MKSFVRSLVLNIFCGFFCAALSSLAQNPAPCAQQTPQKKVWTNEDIASVPRTSVVGNSPSGSRRSSRLPSSGSNGATFINPKVGEIVHPGETFHIDLKVDSGVTPVKGVAILSPMGVSNEGREGPPYSFTFTVPEGNLDGSSHRLIGFQELTLFGTVVGRQDYGLALTTVDVEEPELPLSLYVVGGSISQYDRVPNHLEFYSLGEDQRIDIQAKFPNGHELDVTESTYLTLSSENPAIAFVEEDGTVTSVGPGKTRIIVTYALGMDQKQFSFPVTVHGDIEGNSQGIEVSPATLSFGDVASNTTSSPLQIKITNRAEADIHIFKLVPQGGFLVSAENCSDTSLSPGGSCTITVTFTPKRPGQVHSKIFVNNSYDSMLSISLFGNGT